MPSCLPICLQDQLVFIFHQLDSSSEISTLKSRLEDKGCIGLWGRKVVGHNINIVGFGIQIFGLGWIVVQIIYYFFHKRSHKANNLDISFDGLLKNERLRFIHLVLIFLELKKIGVVGKKDILDAATVRRARYVLTVGI